MVSGWRYTPSFRTGNLGVLLNSWLLFKQDLAAVAKKTFAQVHIMYQLWLPCTWSFMSGSHPRRVTIIFLHGCYSCSRMQQLSKLATLCFAHVTLVGWNWWELSCLPMDFQMWFKVLVVIFKVLCSLANVSSELHAFSSMGSLEYDPYFKRMLSSGALQVGLSLSIPTPKEYFS